MAARQQLSLYTKSLAAGLFLTHVALSRAHDLFSRTSKKTSYEYRDRACKVSVMLGAS